MLIFSSFSFLLFSLLVVMIYYIIAGKYRTLWLLVASYIFYFTYSIWGGVLLFLITLFTFSIAKIISKCQVYKKQAFWISMTVLLAILFFFKYLSFFGGAIISVIRSLSTGTLVIAHIKIFDVLIPVGISFYIFQSMGYVIGVYKKKVPVETDFICYALFLSYFPKLVSGPIEQANSLIPQLKKYHCMTYENVTTGLRWMLIGYFKKIVIADTLAMYVNQVYADVSKFTGLSLMMAVFLFSIQIYCDFSGYSDIAVGISKIMGIDLMINFKSPYFSESIIEFWKRWHISLTDWFRENLYIPLGGNRVSTFRHKLNIIIVFLVSGLWHGANYTYILWGGVHGILQCVELTMKKANRPFIFCRAKKAFKIFICFSVVSIVWIFFRAESLSDATYVLFHLLSGFEMNYLYVANSLAKIGFQKITLLFTIISLAILFVIDLMNYRECIVTVIGKQRTALRWAIYLLLGYMILLAVMFTSQSQNFVYFQF